MQWGFVSILLLMLPRAVRRLQVKNISHCPLQAPSHERFRASLLFKPFLMKSSEKWNWLMPNEYHWVAVIVAFDVCGVEIIYKTSILADGSKRVHFSSASLEDFSIFAQTINDRKTFLASVLCWDFTVSNGSCYICSVLAVLSDCT